MTQATTIERAALFSGYPISVLRGPSRYRKVCMVRWAVMSVLRDKGLSLCTIGRILHRDHSTVMNGLARAEWLRRDEGFCKLVEALA